jgi:hypothetical protein
MELRDITEKLRKAVAAGAHTEATALLQFYRTQLESELAALPPRSAEAAQLAQQARDLFEWARRMTLAARSRMEIQRRPRPRRCPYTSAPTSPRTWSLEA